MSCDVEEESLNLILTNGCLEKVTKLLLEQFHKGLSKTADKNECLNMVVTYVQDLPDGNEKGKVLAIDIAESSFKIFCFDLPSKNSDIKVQSVKYEISKSLQEGSGRGLFEYLADCLNRFIKSQELTMILPLAFSFNFPCRKNNLNNAILLKWTKGFSCSDVVGENVGELLKKALEQKGVPNVKIMAIVNDATAVLISSAYKDPNCCVGLLIGTSTNVAYLEDLKNVETLTESNAINPSRQMIINCEWGALGDNNNLNFIRTKYDYLIDNTSNNPGQQIFEKMVSGTYLGELVRLILVDFVKECALFDGQMSRELETKFYFATEWLPLIQDDVTNNRIVETMNILQSLNITHKSKEDCEIVKLIGSRIVERSAFLASAGIAALLNKLKRPQTTVGVDGSFYHSSPTYKTLMEKKIEELTNPLYKFKLISCKEGTSLGTALIAAIAFRNSNKI